jgi:hypothetical protein
MGTLGVHIKGVLPWLVRWARRAGTIDFCPALAALIGQVQILFFLTAHYFTLLVPTYKVALQLTHPPLSYICRQTNITI